MALPKTSLAVNRCAFPINFDTYKGCEHQCKYCFANLAPNGERVNVKFDSTAKDLTNWIAGSRGATESWCDWNIPICIGRNSDPFQPIERKEKRTLACLKVLAKSGYPFIITTKNAMCAEGEWLEVLKDCNFVMQFSMLCPDMDKLERGASSYEERLAAISKIAPYARRVVARWQPLFLELAPKAMREIPRLKEAGAYAVLCECAFLKKPLGKCNVYTNGQFLYPVADKEKWETRIKQKCHAHGLVFLSSDTKRLSDSLCCCCGDGLEKHGFIPNRCNAVWYYLDRKNYCATAGQKKVGSARAFHNVMFGREDYKKLAQYTFQQAMENAIITPDIKLQMERG